MTVVGDAHDRIEPGRFAEDRVTVIGARIHDIQLDLDADLLRRVLDELGILGNLLEALRRQRHLGAGLDAGRFEKLLGFGDILLALLDAGVGRGIDRREGAVIAGLRPAAQQALDQLVAIETQGNGAAHARILERVHVGAHVDLGSARPNGC
jgi:hypothetical protein